MGRVSIDEILMRHAWDWAERSTCSRLHVGAVLARDGRTISTGYNGAPEGMPHCDHSGDEFLPDPCSAAIHAEANALARAARYGIATDGATLYTTHSPCHWCAGALISAGITGVHYGYHYRSTRGLELLEAAGITITRNGDTNELGQQRDLSPLEQ